MARRDELSAIVVGGGGLTVGEVVAVARHHRPVEVTDDVEVIRRLEQAFEIVQAAALEGTPLYGVTTPFGGMATHAVTGSDAHKLQRNALFVHKCGAGAPLPAECVRAAMLARLNSHLKGASGVRLCLVERLAAMLNGRLTPLVPEHGSIGASGDLVPLNYIAGAAFALDDAFLVATTDGVRGARQAVQLIGLEPLSPQPKEALAMINGTSFSAGMAALCVHDVEILLDVALGIHALAWQALCSSPQPLHPFIHEQKGHPGQRWVASRMRALLDGSAMLRTEPEGTHQHRSAGPIQDRYAQRCAPQYLGPIVDGILAFRRDVETELNGASDNPLVDAETGAFHHGGNFLGQYLAMGLDALRQRVSLMAKHLDVQTAQLMAPEFSDGLPASLVGNAERPFNMGLKGLQLTSNSLSPLIEFYGAPLADRFPTHAEQYNQNLNSQSFNAAVLAQRQIAITRQLIAVSLVIAVQAVDLRARLAMGTCDASNLLSPGTRTLYGTVRDLLGRPPETARPLVDHDDEQWLDSHVDALAHDLASGGRIAETIEAIIGPIGDAGPTTSAAPDTQRAAEKVATVAIFGAE